MPAHLTPLLQRLRRLADPPALNADTDAVLLERFAQQRNEAAFAALLQRHGRLVLGVCRRVLGDVQAAEDAAQATFLVLAKKAGAISRREALAAWLYGVAWRVASKARQSRLRYAPALIARVEPCDPHRDPLAEVTGRELLALVEQEVQRLPAGQRLAVVLCGLEGLSQEEAARRLGWTAGALKGRLERGRRRLHQRLARRGLLPAALAALEVARGSAAAQLPSAWATATCAAALALAEGQTAAISAAVLGLVRTAAPGLGAARLKLVLLLILALGGAAALLSAPEPPAAAPRGAPERAAAVRLDRHGDPLPMGASARLGTVRQRAPDAQIAVSADGKEIVALGPDLVVRRFDAATGNLLSTRRLPAERPRYLRLSPRGTLAALTRFLDLRRGYQLELWDLAQEKRRQTLDLGLFSTEGVAFSADQRRVAIADERPGHGQRVLCWDWEKGESRVLWSQKKEIYQRYFDPVVALSPDGKRLAACHLDHVLRCWDVAEGKLLWQEKWNYGTAFVFFSADGQAVYTDNRGRSGLIRFDAATGERTEEKIADKTALYPAGCSPDGRLRAFVTPDEGMVLWELGSAQPALRLPPPQPREAGHFVTRSLPTNFAFLPDGQGVIRRYGEVQRWDLATGQRVFADTQAWGHTEAVTRLAFAPDGRLLASMAKDHTARLWDVRTARLQHMLPTGLSRFLAFTPDGRHLLLPPWGLGETVLRKWDVATGQTDGGFTLADTKEFMASSGSREMRVTVDGRKVLLLTFKNGRRGDECMLSGWDLASGKCLEHRRVPWAETSLLTGDGQRVLAFDSPYRSVRVLDLATAKALIAFAPERRRDADDDGDCDLALSPDDRLMAARVRYRRFSSGTTTDGVLSLGEMATGRQLLHLPLAGPALFAFSADSRLLVVALADRVRLWEAASGQEIGHLHMPGAVAPDAPCAEALALSPDGRTLATGHADSSILFWDATLRGGAAGQPLTEAQAEACWSDLVGADSARAYVAVWRLADDPRRAVPLIAKRLSPVASPPAEMLRDLLRELGSDQFAERQAAERKLAKLGERAEPALRTALGADITVETKRRIEGLLAALSPAMLLTGEPLRAVRAVQVLERAESAEARRMLERLAQGAPAARLTREARAALQRLEQRPMP
jgi:RNA polymerase sigma factor (sigma-70 family)